MSAAERVRAKWPDADISKAFAVQKDGSRKWMYCVMSTLKMVATPRRKIRVLNVGHWKFNEDDAWLDASRAIGEREGVQ